MVFEGQSILKKTEAEMRSARGNDVSMILQEPMTSLNPVSTVGDQVMEATVIHENASTKKARQKTAEMLRSVNSPHLIDYLPRIQDEVRIQSSLDRPSDLKHNRVDQPLEMVYALRADAVLT